MKHFFSYVKNFWLTNALVLFFLTLITLFQLICKQEIIDFCWIMSGIILPYIISIAANISTSKIELKKIADVKHVIDSKEAEMNTICSEMVGFLEAMKPHEDNFDQKQIKKILTKTRKLQMTILKKGV